MWSVWPVAGVLMLATWGVRASPAAAPQGANPSAVALLERAVAASRNTSYAGTLVYRSEGVMEVLRVTHRVRNGQQDEHIITLTGTPRELLRIGNQLTCFFPRGRRVDLHNVPIKNLFAHLRGPALERLREWYGFQSIAADRVAGRNCLGVAVDPRDGYRYGYRVWVDQATGVPLRVALVDGSARVLEQVMYTQIEFPTSIPDSAFVPTLKDAEGYRAVRQKISAPLDDATPPRLANDAAGGAWTFAAMPPGFTVTLQDQRHMPDRIGVVNHLMVSDGLSSVSVFAAQAEPAGAGLKGLSHIGAVHAYGRFLDGYHVTVVGEAPGRTVKMIGDALELQGQANAGPPPALATTAAH
ncbi:MAG: hypothetical protein EPN72_04025 [Nevskiaceae bacterium]|nr:MAG: hypothetical protein EPN63_06805 [Nevskiaceae bacterium]TBR73986.1 MAG: hypothetical protein EPN72_04025 [Nevskiaceae bacterium]